MVFHLNGSSREHSHKPPDAETKMMGKINTYRGIEVIPLNANSQQLPNPAVPKRNQEGDMNRLPLLADRALVPRVQKYLESNVDKVYVAIDEMADELQRTYKEYSKRKRGVFRASVKQAYLAILRAYGINDQQVSSSEDLTDEEGGRGGHFLDSQQLSEMYKRSAPKAPVDANELIDISSDDSDDGEDGGEGGVKRSANGPSTSHDNSMLPEDFVETEIFKSNDRLRSMMARGKKRKLESQYSSLVAVKRKKNVASLEESFVTFKDVGGMEKLLEEICVVLVHMKHPELYRQIGVPPPRGILLQGPPGCGKTLLANAIAGELEVPLLKVSAPELIHGIAGESEERVRELFEKAIVASPCVLFIDEIDLIMKSGQKDQKPVYHRIISQLLTSLDDLGKSDGADQVLVIAATNKPQCLDPALKRAGRFDKEFCLGVPSYEARIQISKVLTSKLKLVDGFVFETIAKHTPGYVGADLVTLIREAAMIAVKRAYNDLQEKLRLERAVALQKLEEEKSRTPPPEKEDEDDTKDDDDEVVDIETTEKKDDEKDEGGASDAVVIIDDDVKGGINNEKPVVNPATLVELKKKSKLDELLSWVHGDVPFKEKHMSDVCITMDDFASALKNMHSTLQKEGFGTVPDVLWSDIGALSDIRQELQLSILGPIRYAKQFKSLSKPLTGILLCGPPGCGKTLVAKAIANEAGINFISARGSDLLNMYIGESERAVQACFARARYLAPCVLFLDELDVLCSKRSDNDTSMRRVTQVVSEIDSLQSRQDIYVLAASNRPDNIDPTLLRPGRLEKVFYLDLPSRSSRADILRVITKSGTHPMLGLDVDLDTIGKSEECDGFTSADLVRLVQEATMEAIKEIVQSGDTEKDVVVTTDHFKKAVAKVRPTLSEKDQKCYEKLRKQYGTKSLENDVEEMEYS